MEHIHLRITELLAEKVISKYRPRLRKIKSKTDKGFNLPYRFYDILIHSCQFTSVKIRNLTFPICITQNILRSFHFA